MPDFISGRHEACIAAFRTLIQLLTTGQPTNQATSWTQLRDDYDRYQVWAVNVGAAFRGDDYKRSLDYRLRDATVCKEAILKILLRIESLTNQLSTVIRNIDQSDGVSLLSSSSVDGDEVNEDDNDEDSTWSLSSDDGLDRQISSAAPSEVRSGEISFQMPTRRQLIRDGPSAEPLLKVDALLKSLNFSITSLYRIPVRQSANADQAHHLARRYNIDLSYYEPYDIAFVRDLFPNADEQVVSRLGRMISRRRQVLRTQLQHNQELQRETFESVANPQWHQSPTVMPAGTDVKKAREEREDSLKTTTFKPTRVPELGGHLHLEAASSEVAESVSSIATTGAAQDSIVIPPRPTTVNGSEKEDFECPFCCMLVHVRSAHAWKKHVLHDLQPYICTNATCNEPGRMFDDRELWYNHEIQHLSEYYCGDAQHTSFGEAAFFVSHMKEQHGFNKESQLHVSVLNMFLKPRKVDRSVCPLCLVESKDVKRHLGRHLQRIALFALPRHHGDIEDNEAASHASNVPAAAARQSGIDREDNDRAGSDNASGSSHKETSNVAHTARDEMQNEAKNDILDEDTTIVPDCEPTTWEHIRRELHETAPSKSAIELVANTSQRILYHADYTVACICPMGLELAPVKAMLDHRHPSLPTERGQNDYTLGEMGGHNIVIAVLPETRTNSAATVATQLLNDFPSIRFGLLVGIGGGVPDLANEIDIRLGDIVVSKPTKTAGGVVQYDMEKETLNGFERTGTLNKPPAVLRAAVQQLVAQYELEDSHVPLYLSKMLEKYSKMEKYTHPGAEHDQLFATAYEHQGGKTCASCDSSQVIRRPPRSSSSPFIHYGTIVSANRVVKNAAQREKLKSGDLDIMCVEMEAAGLMDSFPCLVIRGICDYADSHKNKKWQPYAAATAAAYLKAILSIIPAQAVTKIPHATSVVDKQSIPTRAKDSSTDDAGSSNNINNSPMDDENRDAKLINAALEGDEALVSFLLDQGADPSATDSQGTTCLHAAAQEGHEAIVRILLDRGSDVFAVTTAGAGTALHIAAEKGHADVIELLVERGSNILAQDKSGFTALHVASRGGHELSVERLLGPCVEKFCKNGFSSFPTEGGNDPVPKLRSQLLSTKSTSEKTALYLAAEEGKDIIVKVLLAYGADPLTNNENGLSAIEAAFLGNHSAVIKALLSNRGPHRHSTATTWARILRTADPNQLERFADVSSQSSSTRSTGAHDGASTSGLLSLEKELVCIICTEVLYQPLTLIYCLHTFCGSCLKEWFSYQCKKASHSQSSQTSNPYTCPICRANVKDARHNATVSTLLDMFLSANPEKARSAQEKEDMAKTYKPGEGILPKLEASRRHDQRARRAEEAAEETECRMIEEARERSLREMRGRGPEYHSDGLTTPDTGHGSGRSGSRDSRDRDVRRERRREQERQERRRRAEAGEAAQAREGGVTSTEARPGSGSASLPLQPTSRHPDAISARRSREIGHQASLRSLVSASDRGTGTDDSLNEVQIMQEILSEGLLDGIDLRDLDAAQEDELSERIAEAYRRRHRMRGQHSPRQISISTSSKTQISPTGATLGEPVPSVERRHWRHTSGSSQTTTAMEANQRAEAAEGMHPPVSRPHLLETSDNLQPPPGSTAHRRRSSDQQRRRTSPNSRNGRTASEHGSQRNEVTRSATDVSSRPQTSDPPGRDRARLLSDTRRTHTEPGQPLNVSDVWRNGPTDSGAPAREVTRAAPVLEGSIGEPSRKPPPPPAEPTTTHMSPRQDVRLATRTRTQYTEPSVSCARCSCPNIQYALHYHCSRCVMDLCLLCYREARGCNHWFGFGKAAQAKFEASHPHDRGSQLIQLPHILVGRKYLSPPHDSVIADTTQTTASHGAVVTTSNPAARLQEGKFCDRCQSFANVCFWSCDYCNEGEWGFCNKCVNTHHCCTHPLLPMSHRSFAPESSKSARGSGYDPSKSVITLTPGELHASIVPATPYDRPLTSEPTTDDGAITEPAYLQLTFITHCDICTDPISPSESRFHCPEHRSPSRHDPENRGDYDICPSCYFNLVKLGKIRREDGPAGWRKCPSGHRMIVVEFDDEFPQLDGHRRVVVNDLVGGHKFTAEAFTADLSGPTAAAPSMVPSAAGRWSWRENSEGKESSRLRAMTLNVQVSKFPPDGGFGKRCLAFWSYYPEEGEGGKGELLFPKGAEVREVEDINEEWSFGVYAGEKGLFPAQYVRALDA